MDFLGELGGSDPLRPSIFELVGQEQLRDLLQPALKYVLSVFAQSYPRYLLRVVNKHEEFYALLMFFVERHYLRRHNASFAENFYGLKRRRKPLFETERANAAVGSHASGQEKLRNRELRLSLLFLVAIPYIRAKAQDYYESLGGGVDADLLTEGADRSRAEALQRQQTLSDRLRDLFKTVYPWTNVGFELWLLGYNVAYLFDQTPFYRPWHTWMGVDVRRMGADDYMPPPTSARQRPPIIPPRSLLTKLRRLLLRSPSLFLDSLKVLLPTAIFFIKFLQWWYSPSSPARALNLSPAGPPIPPPKLLPPHPLGILGKKGDDEHEEKAGYGACPICKNLLANATALPTGWVFCYKCIYKELEERGKCPVTLLRLGTWTLRKVLV
ncbi:ubiquitin-protein ligase peroxin 12 [Tulasnella sp. JGI-2019a]|nr:ubiquitin-protein ligase peroxin 12 [Tulasnella sp. JGI-2019a]KAG9005708.1 ubiquitin-protein ligase peroxin 12 [Tulasnella sp. JGI-2019a]KAG9034976.1 ubiquitin-protein ligase peroxin 12 [Tulasnella sp. JGI-2019a]